MSKLPRAFKAKKHEQMRDFSAIPMGDYLIKATTSDYVANSNKDGHLLKYEFQVQSGEHKGAKLYSNLNLDNSSDKAVEIANSELATICEACGKTTIKDSKETHGIMMLAKVGIEKSEGYPDKNKILMYSVPGDDDDGEGESDDGEPDDDNDGAETTPELVKKLALEYKKLASGKELKEVLEEYDIKLASKIESLDDDDLESLREDLEGAIEDLDD